MKLNEFHDVEELEIIGDQAKSMHKDHEVQMARSELYKAAKSAMALHDMLKHLPEDANIEGWVQAKITKAADYLSSVKSYLEYEQHSTGEITVDEMMPAPVLGESKKRHVAKSQINDSAFLPKEIKALNQYLDDEISFHQLKTGYPGVIRKAVRKFGISPVRGFVGEMGFYDRMVQARKEGDIKEGVAEGIETIHGRKYDVDPDKYYVWAWDNAAVLYGEYDNIKDAEINLPKIEQRAIERLGSFVKGRFELSTGKELLQRYGEKGVAEGSEIQIPTEDGIGWQDIRLLAGEGKLTQKTIKQAINIIRKQRQQKQGVAEGEGMSLQQLATISDEALDNAYHYGRSTPGNSFGWRANLKSAEFAKKAIDSGIKDIEQISDAIHRGWNVTAQAFVKNPDQFDDTAKLRASGKLDAKLQQREKLMSINYAQLPEDEKEKDRVVARALLKALTGGIQETAGATGSGAMATSMGGGNGFKNGGPGTIKRESVLRKKGKK